MKENGTPTFHQIFAFSLARGRVGETFFSFGLRSAEGGKKPFCLRNHLDFPQEKGGSSRKKYSDRVTYESSSTKKERRIVRLFRILVPFLFFLLSCILAGKVVCRDSIHQNYPFHLLCRYTGGKTDQFLSEFTIYSHPIFLTLPLLRLG